MLGMVVSLQGSEIAKTRCQIEDHKPSFWRRIVSFFNCGALPKSFFLRKEVDVLPVNIHDKMRQEQSDLTQEIKYIDDCFSFLISSSTTECQLLRKRAERVYSECMKHRDDPGHADVRYEIKALHHQEIREKSISSFPEVDIEIAKGLSTNLEKKIRAEILNCCDENKSFQLTLEKVVRSQPGRDVRFLQVSKNKLRVLVSNLKKDRKNLGGTASHLSANEKKLKNLAEYQLGIAFKINQLQHIQQIKNEIENITASEPSEWASIMVAAYNAALAEGKKELDVYYDLYASTLLE